MEGDRTLSLTYQKDNTDNSSQCDDVKLLSGGERSFATLALLLALGKQHECPFRWFADCVHSRISCIGTLSMSCYSLLSS